MSIQQNFPAISPSLNLNFARSKTLDPRITFSRTSTATRVNEQGLVEVVSADIPRFDHEYDASTGVIKSLGLLVEEERSNLVTDSITLDNFSNKTNVTVQDNAIISPDGTQNAGKIIETSDTGSHALSRLNVVTTQNTTYTISGYFKKGERKYVQISFRNVTFWGTPGGPSASFNLETGTLYSTSGVVSNPTIINVGNGWYRCSVSATRDGSGTITSGITVGTLDDVPNISYQGIIGYGIYAWGLQFEAGSFPTSYIPTSGSTATRNPDNVSMTGDNFSDWYNPSEGAISITCSTYTDGSDYINALTLSDGSLVNLNNTLEIALTSSTTNTNVGRLTVRTNGSTPVDVNASGVITNLQSNKKYKMMASYEKDDFAFSVDGVTYFTDTSGDLPLNISKLSIGHRRSNLDMLFGHISQLTYYPRRLTNTQLQTLTL